MFYYLVFLGFLSGVLMVFQTGINAQLRVWLGHPAQAALISFAVGTLGLIAYNLALRLPWPPVAKLTEAPWWVWSGGFLGAFFVAVSTALAPRLGATLLASVIVAGQLTASIIFDHYGFLGFPQHSIGIGRVVGAILLFLGVVLIRIY